MEFPFSAEYLRAISPANGNKPTTEPGEKSSGKSSGKNLVKASVKSEDRIVTMLQAEPRLSIPVMATTLGVTPRTVEKQIRQLKAKGRLRRVGPAKGGHWEVIL